MEEIVITKQESPVLRSVNTKYPFPAVRVCGEHLYFNHLAGRLFTGKGVTISTAEGYIIFRCSESPKAFTLNKRSNNTACISSVKLIRSKSLKIGAAYKLYAVSGGGYAIKLHEPLEE